MGILNFNITAAMERIHHYCHKLGMSYTVHFDASLDSWCIVIFTATESKTFTWGPHDLYDTCIRVMEYLVSVDPDTPELHIPTTCGLSYTERVRKASEITPGTVMPEGLWNRNYRHALSQFNLTISTHLPEDCRAYPDGLPDLAPHSYGDIDGWPQESYIVFINDKE